MCSLPFQNSLEYNRMIILNILKFILRDPTIRIDCLRVSRAAAQAADTLAVGMSWEVGSASEYPCFRALTANGDINLTLTQVRPAQRHTTLTTNLQSPEASKTTQVTE